MRPLLLAAALAVVPAAVAAPPVVVEAQAPGSSPRVVADTVAEPLERQLLGTPGVRQVRSLSTDGRCVIRLDLDPRADRSRVRADVANRVALAGPQLPEAARRGVQLRPDADDAVVAVALRTGDRADPPAIAAAADRLRQRLRTVPQVADVVPVGVPEVGLRVYIDAHRLAAFNITHTAVIDALRPAATPAPGRPAPTAEGLDDLVVATTAGQPVRLRNLAAVRLGINRPTAGGVARPGGEPAPAVLLLVRPAAGATAAVTAAVGRLLDGPGIDLPAGMTLDRLAFGPADQVVTLRVPASAAAERRAQLGHEAAGAAARVANVGAVAWVAWPGDGPVTLFVSGLAADLGKAELSQAGPAVRVGRLRWPADDWPGEAAGVVVRVTGDKLGDVGIVAKELADQLSWVQGITDRTVEPGERPDVMFDIDRPKAAAFGVPVAAITETLELARGGVRVGSVVVGLPEQFRRGGEEVRNFRLPNGQGQLVPLGGIVAVREALGPAAVYREGGRPCRVVASNVRGRDAAAVKADVRKLARQLARPGVTVSAD
ncbi:MAG TPA: efflux RND transporter permease subunit [Gemmataceae bacterium]|jgi:multidrug efflux pump subunit AcrB